jgi:hypothetical protein
MFGSCSNVESGALALYQQMTAQDLVPEYHSSCFSLCGSNTVTGLAELNQIPKDWGGRME